MAILCNSHVQLTDSVFASACCSSQEVASLAPRNDRNGHRRTSPSLRRHHHGLAIRFVTQAGRRCLDRRNVFHVFQVKASGS